MPNFKLTIAYDGTGFVGWQRQASGVSIQGLLEDALGELDGRDVVVTGAGRTDAGVHAIAQVAAVALERNIDGHSVLRAVNTRLPESVRVIEAVEVPAAFHPRFNARSKTYRYRMWNGEVISPFERAYAWHLPPPPLDAEAMSAAARLVEGRHDFAAFQAAGTEPHGTERVVFSARIFSPGADRAVSFVDSAYNFADRASGSADRAGLLEFEICGSGFLRHMVRNIVGSLVEVGRGRRPVAWIEEVFASRERARAGPTAPAEGLFLVAVEYM